MQICQAFFADKFSLVNGHLVVFIAKDAGGCIFGQNNAARFGPDFERILGSDLHGVSDLLGKNDSPKIVDGSYNSGGFHKRKMLQPS